MIQAILGAQILDFSNIFFTSVLSSAFINYRLQYKDILVEEYFNFLKIHAVVIPVNVLTNFGKEAFFKSLVEACANCDEMHEILKASTKQISESDMEELSMKTLFSDNALSHWEHYSNLICFISKFHNSLLTNMLKRSMVLWSDPVIAKAYVYQEVIHFTKLSLFIFTHLNPKSVTKNQDMLIRLVGQGLPNHFASTDPRSIHLAKFFCEIITESLKLYENKSDEIPKAIRQPDDQINQDLLQCLHKCDKCLVFWTSFDLDRSKSEKTECVKTSTGFARIVFFILFEFGLIYSDVNLKTTHGNNNLPIPAIAYFINNFDSQSSGRGRGRTTFLYVVDIFYKLSQP